MTGREEVIDLYRRHVSRGLASLAQIMGSPMEVQSCGSRVVTPDGEELLDCGGYGVFILGHCHPTVVSAVIGQLRRHPLATSYLLEPEVAFTAKALAEVTPPGLEHVRFATSGAEAVEAALKLARANGKKRIIAACGGYHGKTLGALSATPNPLYQAPFEPLLPAETAAYGDTEDLARLLAKGPEACVLVEPVQGEGGVVVPPEGYLTEVARLCREFGALLVVDEIQTGLGRLGEWFGVDREGVVPDMLLVGKGLSGGVVPVAAMVATTEAYLPFDQDPVLHSSTFGGSPLAMAAARAAITTIAAEEIVPRSRRLGAELLAEIDEITSEMRPEPVVEVRGRGLLIGIEMSHPHLAADLALALLERGIIVNHSLNSNSTIRLTPPAVLSDADMSTLFSALSDSLHELDQSDEQQRRNKLHA
ncbi:MAG TPA: aminotransferase class III-fold pyridoxal phosphate-dependent enzyme [Solirubrobacterales bacterium]|nr:aminotransferase class III-fold pyridoxal phosphate-dependent enzyme [Solirubrobacterales bacterium]